ncbi:hypothetical protein VISI1226_22752 [Vibrio sinaloensis DSM 21326]|uniref:Uncharacterized protein n=1 Tax=Vibrio sinaloensis DSM 21326 TaxID=945550 RepID=E8MDM0_PHOS4|nr:hypothetical protein VISI1226_22752 [Vibrio sinaloensis DSM 21326]
MKALKQIFDHLKRNKNFYFKLLVHIILMFFGAN